MCVSAVGAVLNRAAGVYSECIITNVIVLLRSNMDINAKAAADV